MPRTIGWMIEASGEWPEGVTRAAGSPHIPRTISVNRSATGPSMMTTDESLGIAAHRPSTAASSPPYVVLDARPSAVSEIPSGPPVLTPRPNVVIEGGSTRAAARTTPEPTLGTPA